MSKFLTLLFVFCSTFLFAQTAPKLLTIEEVISSAQEKSPAAKQAATQFKNKYWQYRSYKSQFLPQLSLNGTAPDLTRTITSITQPDGTEQFRRRSLTTSSVNLSLAQNLALTGGSVFVTSQLQRIDNFTNLRSTSYLAYPALIGFNQPIKRYNPFNWDKKIEPLKYQESIKKYNEDMELVAIRAAEVYFNLLTAQLRTRIEEKNLAINDTLYKISVGRYNLGKIAENELLQMELSVMNAKNKLAQAKLDEEIGFSQLATFLNMDRNETVLLSEPPIFDLFAVDENKAVEEGMKNRQEILGFQRQRLEAQKEVSRAKGETRFNANLVASYGLSNNAAVFEGLYDNPQDQQQLQLGFQVPIMDWGKSKSQIRTAAANKELTDLTIDQSLQSFKQEIILQARQFSMYHNKAFIAAKSDTIAQKRYDIAVKRFMIGKISITDLNNAAQEKDVAKLSYLEALKAFWNAYFELRRKTLYDFRNNAPIEYKTN